MSLGQHLLELRKRLFLAAIAVVLVSVAGFFLSDYVIDALRVPIEQIGKERDAKIVYDTVGGSFDIKITIAFTIGIVGSSPIWLYQIFAFLVPGLNRREKRYTFGFLFSAIPLFIAGAATGWYLFPHMVELLGSFAAPEDATFLPVRTYYDFVIKLVLAVGVAYVLPVFLVLLNFAGVLTAKSIIKSWRIAVLAIVVFAAIATPAADINSMFLLAVPMVVLYLLSAGISWIHDRAIAKRVDAIDAELATS